MVKSEPKIYSPSTSPVVVSSPEDPSSSINKMTKKKFKGVRMRSWGSWVSEIRAPNQKTRIWLGSYSTPEAAARAYDAALLCIKGSSAGPSLNFPISTASYYGIPQDGHSLMSPKSIQRVAAAAAATSCDAMGGASATPAFSPPPPPSLSPSYDESSSPMSHCSPSDHHEDEVSVYHAHDHYDHMWEGQVSEPMANIDAWCNFDSPKYADLMLNGAAFDTAAATNFLADDFFNEQGDIRLWSFC